jgi:hypothetical protein
MESYICPRYTLERAWDVMAGLHMSVISCQRDAATADQLCKVRVAREEAKRDSIWYQWWFWSVAGAVVGAAVVSGIHWGEQIVD